MKLLKRGLSIAMALTMALTITGSMTVSSYADSSLQKAKDSLSSVQDKIQEVKEQLTSGKKEENSLTNQIEQLDQDINAAQDEIEELGAGIQTKQQEITAAQENLIVIQGELDVQNESLDNRLRAMYKRGETSILQILLGSSNFSEFMTNLDMVQRIYDSDVDVLQEIQDRYDTVEQKKADLEKMKNDLETQKDAYEAKQDELEADKAEAAALREEVASSNAELEKQVDQLNEEANALTATIQQLQNPDTVYTGGSMIWPCSGQYTITSPFGYRIHPILKVKKMHTGMDISAPKGTAILAANSGTVIYSAYRGGYGNCVMVDHGGGIVTLYGHASKLLVSSGQQVNAGDTIALVGSTGQSTGNHLHFEVRVNGQYVDPAPYIGA